jgi:small-conductance mechanosensitive channel
MRLVIVLTSLLMLMFPVAAQEQAAPADAATDASIAELVTILEDDAARAALIERLRGAAVEAGAATDTQDLSLARRLAEYTKAVAEGTSATVRGLGLVVADLQQGWSGVISGDGAALRDMLIDLVLVGVILFGAFLLLRVVVRAMESRVAARVVGRHWSVRLAAALGFGLVDLGSVLLAWAVGYFSAVTLIGEQGGQMEVNQSLLLNAFLVVELVKLVVRIILAPGYPALRLLPVGDSNAAYWHFWAARIISLIGYTFLFASPLLAATFAPSAAASLQVLVMATAVTIGIVVVLQNKEDVRQWLDGIAARRDSSGFGQLLMVIGRIWHVLAITYLLALLVVWFTNPDEALPFMLGATVQSAIAVMVGTVVAGFIARFVTGGLNLPPDVRRRLPLLEARLHAYVPKVMLVVRWAVILAVVAAIVQAWQIFNVVQWATSDGGLQALGAVISAALIILACIVAHIVVASWVEYRLNTQMGRAPTAREKTLLNLFRNAFTVALVVFGLMLALAQIGVNIAPLLAGAGVIGLAIGFGAQKLVEDIITGIFIQFENVMNEGDVVAVGDKSGVVEKLTIRSVTIRDLSGTVHLIPFSSVSQVSNMVRGFSYHVAEIGVAYDSDIGEVKQALQEAFTRLMETEHKAEILDELDMQGVIAFGDSAITVRARIKTLPGKQWGTGRAYSEIVKTVFSEKGIEIPYPHVTYVPSAPSRKPRLPPIDPAPIEDGGVA